MHRRNALGAMAGWPLAAAWPAATAVEVSAASAAEHSPGDSSTQPVRTVVETGSAFYTFESFRLASKDGRRGYRIVVSRPRAARPATGYPVAYLLDGNEAMAALTEADLKVLDRLGPPVLVALGHDTNAPFDPDARSVDYTPPSLDGRAVPDPFNAAHAAGGAEVFLQLLEKRIRPEVQRRVPIDVANQAIWGHSYGALFVLYALFTRPAAFRTYAAISASVWWGGGITLQREAAAQKLIAAAAPRRLLMMSGSVEVRPRAGGETEPMATARGAIPRDAAPGLARRLALIPGLEVQWHELEGLTHPQMLQASLMPSLRFALGAGE